LAWQSVQKVTDSSLAALFVPGDTINLKCGSLWVDQQLWFVSAGTEGNPITITSYGTGTRPHLTFPSAGMYDDVVHVEGADWVIVENLILSDGGEAGVRFWSSSHCIVRYCESYNNGMGFETEGTAEYNLFTHNYAHDLHEVVNTPGGDDDYGGVGVWMYSGNNEISYNTMINCRYPSYDYIWDGGAVEYYSKTTRNGGTGNCNNVYIHHNWSEGAEGFHEVGGEKGTACWDNVNAWNVSLDYSNWLCLHVGGKFGVDTQRYRAENNTIDHPGGQYYLISWSGGNPNLDVAYVKNNIIKCTGLDSVSNSGTFTHKYNCYRVINMPIGYTLDPTEFEADPLFVDVANKNYHLQSGSPCRDTGTNLGWTSDYDGNPVPSGSGYDIGAFEYQSGPQPPVANFSGNPTSGNVPLTVLFTDLSTGSPTSWSWTFGDGGTSTAQNPSHQYTVANTYTVSLTATNAQGQDTETKPNYISALQPGAPVADFSGSPTSGYAPLTVNFTDLSTGNPTSWSWTFGDGGSSTAQNPSHQYTSANDYTVSLTAANAYGQDTETKVNYIHVSSGGLGDYFAQSVTVDIGTIQSGTVNDTHASDNTYLVLLSAKACGNYATRSQWTFNTGLPSLSSLTITFEWHEEGTTSDQVMKTYLWNGGGYSQVDQRTVTSPTSDTTIVIPVSGDLSQYINNGEVRVQFKVGEKDKTYQWTHHIDLLKITAAP
jgi:PKD repeat protein